RQREVGVVGAGGGGRRGGGRHGEVEVAAGPDALGALAGDADPLVALDARRDLDVDLPARALPARAVAGRARLALDVAGAPAGRAWLVEVERERPARAVEGFLERGLD